LKRNAQETFKGILKQKDVSATVGGDCPEVLGIIPARGGSKGLPRKNSRLLCGKPLVAYSIEAALQTPNINRVVVSTDDEEIAELSTSFGAEVPFLRPKHLAGDRADIGATLSHLRSRLRADGYRYNAQVALYPTHLFRSIHVMEQLVDKLLSGYTNVYTVKPAMTSGLGYCEAASQRILPLLDESQPVNGSGYIRINGSFLGTSFIGDNVNRTYYHLLSDPVEQIDIDTLEDFLFAEEVIRSGLHRGLE
jgi:N-acylneuraminate cytidylyltransferase